MLRISESIQPILRLKMTNSPTPADTRRQFLLLAASIFQIVGSSLPFIFDWGIDVGERSRALDTAIVPAGWAFSIWSVIFAWSIIFALYTLAPKISASPLARHVSYPITATFIANGVWSLYVPFNNIDWISLIIISTGLFFALTALFSAGKPSALTGPEKFIIRAPIALVAGWLTAATFVGTSSILILAGIKVDLPILLGLLGTATLLAAFVTRQVGGWIYLAPILWALIAIIDKNNNAGDQSILVAAVSAISVLILVRLLFSRQL